MYFFFNSGVVEAESWISNVELFLFYFKTAPLGKYGSKHITWGAEIPDSQLVATFFWSTNFNMVLVASGDNCKQLIKIHDRYLRPTFSLPAN
jgi:hypothetical protein